MVPLPGLRISPAPARVSFDNVPIGSTAQFQLPAGVGELQYDAVDPSIPGVVTLYEIIAGTSYSRGTLTHSIGDFPGYGSLYFQTMGGTFYLDTTVAADAFVIYFADNDGL